MPKQLSRGYHTERPFSASGVAGEVTPTQHEAEIDFHEDDPRNPYAYVKKSDLKQIKEDLRRAYSGLRELIKQVDGGNEV